MRNIVLLIIAAVLANSCADTEQAKNSELASTVLSVDVDQIENVMDLTPYIDTITVVPLQESDGGYLGSVDQMLFIHNHYVVLDRTLTFSAYVFDSEGKFVSDLIGIGKGPNEALQINTLWKDKSGNLQALDYASRKVFSFDANFELIETMDYPDSRYLDVAPIPNSEALVASSAYNYFNSAGKETEHLLTVLNRRFEKQKGYLPIPDELKGAVVMMGDGNFFTYKNVLRFFKTFDNTIYTLDSLGQLDAEYKVQYSVNELTTDLFQRLALEAPERQVSFSTSPEVFTYSFFYSNWYENDSFASFYSIADSKKFFTLYDKGNAKVSSAYELRVTTHDRLVEIPHLRFHDGQAAYSVINTASAGLETTELYKQVLRDFPEGSFVLLKVKFK